MISDLLSAIRCNNWEEAEHILCGHWLARSPLVFAVKRDQLWDVKWNQTLISWFSFYFTALIEFASKFVSQCLEISFVITSLFLVWPIHWLISKLCSSIA